MDVRSVPITANRAMFVSVRNPRSHQLNQYKTVTFCICLAATTQQQHVGPQSVSTIIYSDAHLHQTRLYLCPVGRPFGPPKEEKGVQHMLFLFLKNCFSWAAWNLFDVGNQSVPTHPSNNIPFGSLQCTLEGVKTRPKCRTTIPGNEWNH